MIALSSRPFCSCDGRRVSLGYLSAGLRYTTRHCIWAEGEPARGFLHGYGAALGALRQSQDDDGCCPQGAGTRPDAGRTEVWHPPLCIDSVFPLSSSHEGLTMGTPVDA